MQILSDKGARVAGITAVAAAFLVLSYASALAGDQGGGVKDQVGANYGYTSYSAEGAPSTPCQSCYDGAGPSGHPEQGALHNAG
jgi:hypothetical protein